MELKGILSISGEPDLFKLVKNARNGVIVESLRTKKRMQAFASHKISSLSDISIYTTEEDLPLKDVFDSIYTLAEGGKAVDEKSDKQALVEYFAKVVPNYDLDRVHISDMKRVFKWYNLLQELDLLKLEEKQETEEVIKNEEQTTIEE